MKIEFYLWVVNNTNTMSDQNTPSKMENKQQNTSKKVKKCKKVISCKKHKTKPTFKKQITRKDVLENLLNNLHLTGEELFNLIVNEKSQETDRATREGWLFETLCEILIALKCISGINYTQIYEGQLQNLRPIKNIKKILNVNITGGGNNISDMTIRMLFDGVETTVPWSFKYKKGFKETDVVKINDSMLNLDQEKAYKIGLIVKDKEVYLKHRYNNKKSSDKRLIDDINKNNLLFDKSDIIVALDVFRERFVKNRKNIDEFIEFINDEYLSSPRQQLVKRLHQAMTLYKFRMSFLSNKHRLWCISHKCRSGKSLTMLLIAKNLLENNYKKILIMTAVPATIDSFEKDLNSFIDFKNINYKLQKDFKNLDTTFNGIALCSVQYLKSGTSIKKKKLKDLAFDAIFVDESHFGSSTDKTKNDILEACQDISKSIKIKIFASGTADKTKKYYGIHPSCVYEWEIEDEAYMKQLQNLNISKEREREIINNMYKRHGKMFKECLKQNTLNKDYSKCPTQVLMKQIIPSGLIEKIKKYNAAHDGTNFGYNCSSLFALKQIINENGEVEYAEEFELCEHPDGKDIIYNFLDYIISSNRMRETIMKQVERTQSSYGSRKSDKTNPLLFIIYLPTHTRNNTISSLQKTLIKFIEKHELWEHYNVEYSNGQEDSSNVKEEYNNFITSIMNKTREQKKKGCILLLGNKGSVGITYKDCDVTISLDDGHNLDNQKQRFSRALTDAEGKKVGINVDMNVQRVYLYMINLIHKHRRTMRTREGDAEILYYLFKNNMFLFDPQEFNNGKIKSVEILSYYKKEVLEMLKEIDDTPYLEGIECNDDMRDMIMQDFKRARYNELKINEDLEGENQDCPKGDKTKTQIDGPNHDPKEENPLSEEEIKEHQELINKTYEMCSKFLFPLIALISRSYNIFDFKEVLTRKSELIKSLLENKIENIENNYNRWLNIMNSIIENNEEIVNNIRTIYKTAPANKLRKLIAKHFIPSKEDKKENAEVPTSVKLVNDMLKVIPLEFWKNPHKVFEGCCGKGNFVLGIFDAFYEGLKEMYPDEIERCRVISTTCIYFGDITALNVFITKELLKCHIQSYCGEKPDYEFNGYVGDTLKFDAKEKWGIDGFDAVIGNPPYNSSGRTSTGNTIWQNFTKKALNEWLLPNGYLSFVHPAGWRKPTLTSKEKMYGLYKLMAIDNQMIYLSIHTIKDANWMFVGKVGTRTDWYLIQKKNKHTTTLVNDEENTKITIDMGDFNWLPSYNISAIQKILAKEGEKRCPIIYNRSNYGSDRPHTSTKGKNDEFKYPVVRTIPKTGIRYLYSKYNDKGHFGIKKVIFADNGLNDVIIDMKGKYATGENAMSIQVSSLEEATELKRCLLSDKFKQFINTCIFGNFRIDWRLFHYLKEDFYKDKMFK